MRVGIGIAQVTGRVGERAHNLEVSKRACGEAFDRGARLVVLPELISSGYTDDPAVLARAAESLDGPSVEAWQAIARARGGYVIGGFCEQADGELFNATALVGPEGVVLHYRKLHLFSSEKLGFTPGDLGLPVAELEFGTIGVCVCYDLRFVEVVRALSLKGAHLICVPTAWLAGFDSVRWDERGLAPQAASAILQANLDQVFIACASQAGTADGPDFLGSSILTGPRGELLVGPAAGTREQIYVVEVDLEDAISAQKRGELITPRADRRTDVYGLRIGSEIL